MADFIHIPIFVFDGDAVATGANTGWSRWFPASSIRGMQLFSYATSAGAATITIDMQLSPTLVSDSITTHAPATLNEEKEVAAAGTAITGMFHDPPGEADRPFGQFRLKVTCAAADITGLWLVICGHGAG